MVCWHMHMSSLYEWCERKKNSPEFFSRPDVSGRLEEDLQAAGGQAELLDAQVESPAAVAVVQGGARLRLLLGCDCKL